VRTRKEGVNFSRFCADALYERPLNIPSLILGEKLSIKPALEYAYQLKILFKFKEINYLVSSFVKITD